MARGRSAAPWAASLWWGLVGVLVGFGVAGIATIGLFLLAGAALAVVLGLTVPALRPPCVPGFLVGLSTAPLYIAWLNRHGPGRVCQTTSVSVSCADAWSPWPFVALGVLFAAVGLGLLALGRRANLAAAGASPGAAGTGTPT